MSIPYTYTILNVDEQARCMEVVYESEGRAPHHVGARLPYEGESLEDVIAMYSPVAVWLEQERAVVVPTVGTSGQVEPPVAPAPSQGPQIPSMWNEVMNQQALASLLMSWGVLKDNPTAIPISQPAGE